MFQLQEPLGWSEDYRTNPSRQDTFPFDLKGEKYQFDELLEYVLKLFLIKD